MGSSRFPGKVFEMLGAFKILEWVLERVRRARLVDHVVIATTTNPLDDCIEHLAKQNDVSVFRGSENDVLGRFIAAAELVNAEHVIRICADNPLIDPKEIDRLIAHFYSNPCHYAFNNLDRGRNGYADGFGAEILTIEMLKHLAYKACDQRYREHVTLYLWDNESDYKIETIQAPPGLRYPNLRFDVDTPDDLIYLSKLVKAGVDINSSSNKIIQIALNI